jgi:hypothetical protein
LDVVQIRVSLQPQNRIDGKLREMILILAKHLGAQRSPRNGIKIFAELLRVLRIIDGRFLESLKRGLGGDAVPVDDSLRVYLLVD